MAAAISVPAISRKEKKRMSELFIVVGLKAKAGRLKTVP